MKFILLFMLVLALAHVSQAQQVVNVLPTDFEQGDISEIKDKRRAFVSVISRYHRENILKELAKHKDDIEIVTRPSDADFVIAFAVQRELAGISNFGPYQEKYNYYARLSVYIQREGKIPRVVWKTSKLYTDLLNKQIPITNMKLEITTARDFVKALKKVRGER